MVHFHDCSPTLVGLHSYSVTNITSAFCVRRSLRPNEFLHF